MHSEREGLHSSAILVSGFCVAALCWWHACTVVFTASTCKAQLESPELGSEGWLGPLAAWRGFLLGPLLACV